MLHCNSLRSCVLKTTLLFTILNLFACKAFPPTDSKSNFSNIDIHQSKKIIEKLAGDTSFVILDVRTPGEFRGGHLKSAQNIDFYSKNFKQDLEKHDKSKHYLLYCHSGVRSSSALDIMKKLKFIKVSNMLGGITKWRGANFPTVK